MQQFSERHQVVIDRFVDACKADIRIVAAFLIGSYAKSKADEYSDFDLCVVTTDEAYDEFFARRDEFIRLLDEPVFFEDFDLPDIAFVIFANGAEGELYFGRESQIDHLLNEPFEVLVDKKNIADQAGPHPRKPRTTAEAQTKKLRRLIFLFWHEFSHFITAMGRNQLWWARGQLDELRSICVGLARMRNNFSDSEVDGEVYFKIEGVMPVEDLSSLRNTFCPLDRNAMLESVNIVIRFYHDLAIDLVTKHGIAYPNQLERIMLKRLEDLS